MDQGTEAPFVEGLENDVRFMSATDKGMFILSILAQGILVILEGHIFFMHMDQLAAFQQVPDQLSTLDLFEGSDTNRRK